MHEEWLVDLIVERAKEDLQRVTPLHAERGDAKKRKKSTAQNSTLEVLSHSHNHDSHNHDSLKTP